MVALIPFPYRLLILAILVAVVFASGLVVGLDWCSDRKASAAVKESVRFIEKTKRIVVADNTGMDKLQKKNAALEAEIEKLQEEVRRHAAEIPDPVECRLDVRRMHTIRRAWGAVDPDPGDGKGRVPNRDESASRPPAAVGKPQRPGSVGGAMGPEGADLPRVRSGARPSDRP